MHKSMESDGIDAIFSNTSPCNIVNLIFLTSQKYFFLIGVAMHPVMAYVAKEHEIFRDSAEFPIHKRDDMMDVHRHSFVSVN